ncbi:hypothetical protein D9M71_713180 [compost metagenome]
MGFIHQVEDFLFGKTFVQVTGICNVRNQIVCAGVRSRQNIYRVGEIDRRVVKDKKANPAVETFGRAVFVVADGLHEGTRNELTGVSG